MEYKQGSLQLSSLGESKYYKCLGLKVNHTAKQALLAVIQRDWRDLNSWIAAVLFLQGTRRKRQFGHMKHSLSGVRFLSLLLCLIPEWCSKGFPNFLFFKGSTLWQHLYITILKQQNTTVNLANTTGKSICTVNSSDVSSRLWQKWKKPGNSAENILENRLLYVLCLSCFKKYLLYLLIIKNYFKNLLFSEKMQGCKRIFLNNLIISVLTSQNHSCTYYYGVPCTGMVGQADGQAGQQKQPVS